MNKPLFRDGISLVYDVVMNLEANSMFGKEDATVSILRDGLARLLSSTRHEGVWE